MAPEKVSIFLHFQICNLSQAGIDVRSVMSQLNVHIETYEIHDEQKFAGCEGHVGEVLVHTIRETEHV